MDQVVLLNGGKGWILIDYVHQCLLDDHEVLMDQHVGVRLSLGGLLLRFCVEKELVPLSLFLEFISVFVWITNRFLIIGSIVYDHLRNPPLFLRLR